jgi:hypothetical protein
MEALSRRPGPPETRIDSTAVPRRGPTPIATTVPETGTVPVSTTVASRPRFRIFRATRAEHGHSIGEHLIYEVLWRNAQGDQSTRTIQIGYDRLAALANVNWKTALSCLRGLEQKLAIETIEKENSNARIGKTYRIYSFTLILERRRDAGMEWVEKGRGVRFIQPGTVPVSTTVPDPGTVPDSRTVVDTGIASVPDSTRDTVPDSGISISIGNIRKEQETSSSPISDACHKYGLAIDDDAIIKIIRRCRLVDPDATETEIAHFTSMKINQLSNSRNIGNWIGLLIASVPAYFQGQKKEVLAYRRQKMQERAEALDVARSILNDPDSLPESREWAEKELLTATQTR